MNIDRAKCSSIDRSSNVLRIMDRLSSRGLIKISGKVVIQVFQIILALYRFSRKSKIYYC